MNMKEQKRITKSFGSAENLSNFEILTYNIMPNCRQSKL